jgi:branched-chain amino acid transport system permease protein
MSVDKIGQDEWVEQLAARQAQRGPLGRALARLEAANPFVLAAVVFALMALVPALTSNDYVVRVAANVCLYAALAAGLNVVVGYAGLLDLGYVAFFGIGGYAYAMLSSEQFGLHLPTWASVPIVVAIAALFGLLLGLPSLRLIGDYLAIVTLGFGQIFVLLANNLDRLKLPGMSEPFNVTGGPNGITSLDPFHIGSLQATGVRAYFFLLLAALALTLLVVYNIDRSRVGRAWRAMREDALAAESMGMPIRRLRLLAFVIGAAIAGFSGSIFAAWQTSVFPQNFDVTLLITLYAMVVLGGVGSLRGALIGAALLTVLPELLRDPLTARLLFYGGAIVVLLLSVRPWWRALGLLAAVIALGLVVKLAARALFVEQLGPPPQPAAGWAAVPQSWLVFPASPQLAGNLAFVLVVVLLAAITRVSARLRLALLVPALYLLAFVWEARLALEPSVTRLLFYGAILVVLMTYRPHGIFGKPRVEVV